MWGDYMAPFLAHHMPALQVAGFSAGPTFCPAWAKRQPQTWCEDVSIEVMLMRCPGHSLAQKKGWGISMSSPGQALRFP